MNKQFGRVIWITGLSGAGKSTLAREIVQKLRDSEEIVASLDGDELRDVFGSTTTDLGNYDRKGRLTLAMRYSRLCYLIANQGFTVVIATISLFREVHAWNRTNLPGYFEVFLRVPIEELRRRDPKGIYRRFDSGELSSVAGLDLSIDEPEAADYVLEFDSELSLHSVTDELIRTLAEKKREK